MNHHYYRKIRLLLIIGFLSLFLAGWATSRMAEAPSEAVDGSYVDKVISSGSTLAIGATTIDLEVADTIPEKIKGLSGRESLPVNTGLLFVFDKPEFHQFWMKDMLFSIDIIWISADYKVVDITKNASPETFPEFFTPREKAQYVLEVNAGFSDKKNIKIGDSVIF